jgi:RNA polymerase sigma-70 factor (ECF subfamily)
LQPATHTNTDLRRSSISGGEERLNAPAEAPPPEPGPDTSLDWVRNVAENDGPGILRTLWRLLRSEQDAMDAYQDCFCKLAALAPDRAPNQARAYAYRAAINAATEIVRRRTHRAAHLCELRVRTEQVLTSSDDDEREVPAGDALALLPAAIADLPAHLRNVVVLRDLTRLSYEEVGRMLGIAPATARVYRRHAIVKLGEMLDRITPA